MDNKFKIGDRVRKLATASAGKVLTIGVTTKYRIAYKVEFLYCTDWFLEDELEKAEDLTPIEKIMADSDFIYPPVEGSICYKMGCDEKAVGALENWTNEKIGEDYFDYISTLWLCEKHLIEQYQEYHHDS